MVLLLTTSYGITQVPEVLLQDFDGPNKNLLVGLQRFLGLPTKSGASVRRIWHWNLISFGFIWFTVY